MPNHTQMHIIMKQFIKLNHISWIGMHKETWGWLGHKIINSEQRGTQHLKQE